VVAVIVVRFLMAWEPMQHPPTLHLPGARRVLVLLLLYEYEHSHQNERKRRDGDLL
jgi:hypothetical protein